MKGEYLISAVLAVLAVQNSTGLIIPSHQIRNRLLMNQTSPRRLTGVAPKTLAQPKARLVAAQPANARELRKSKSQSVPYQGFKRTRPLMSNK